MPAPVADHVAAVALFGEPSSGFSTMLWGGQPLPTINPIYASKTISLCTPDDPFCSAGGNIVAHVSYIQSGMTKRSDVRGQQAGSSVCQQHLAAPHPGSTRSGA